MEAGGKGGALENKVCKSLYCQEIAINALMIMTLFVALLRGVEMSASLWRMNRMFNRMFVTSSSELP